jgi:hypothetical protein
MFICLLVVVVFVKMLNTNQQNDDYHLKQQFLKREERIVFALQKLFGSGSRAKSMVYFER